jgi:ABC-2 type transport system ATP-binding protein
MHLQIRNVSKTYPNGIRALKNVTLTIPPGMYGLLGPNGAGKSTLMRTIATLQDPDEGSIHLGDLDVLRQKDEVRKTLGYLPQEFGVYPNVTAQRTWSLRSLAACRRHSRSTPRRREVRWL